MSLEDIFQCSSNILEGITYKLFVTALLHIDDIEDDNITYLEPAENLTKDKIRDFLQERVVWYALKRKNISFTFNL